MPVGTLPPVSDFEAIRIQTIGQFGRALERRVGRVGPVSLQVGLPVRRSGNRRRPVCTGTRRRRRLRERVCRGEESDRSDERKRAEPLLCHRLSPAIESCGRVRSIRVGARSAQLMDAILCLGGYGPKLAKWWAIPPVKLSM